MTRLTKRQCLNCTTIFLPDTVAQVYCQATCRQGAARVRDRERKRAVYSVRKGAPSPNRDSWNPDRPDSAGPAIIGTCIQCHRHTQLRYDTWGPVSDGMLIADPVMCSRNCAVAYYLARPCPPSPDEACEDIRRELAGRRQIDPGDEDLEDDDDWHDWESEYPDDEAA